MKMKIELPKSGYEVRAAQLITQYGVGAMIDFPEHTLMVASPLTWGSRSCRTISDVRLERRLGVGAFREPTGVTSSDGNASENRITYVRFPKWYRCPSCRLFLPIDDWLVKYQEAHPDADDRMVRHMRCPNCARGKLTVTRFVTICAHGHISDFPWRAWVSVKGQGGNVDCPHHCLELLDKNNGSSGLDAVVVRCRDCRRQADMGDSFQSGVFTELARQNPGLQAEFRCPGEHHWDLKGGSVCAQERKVVLRGSSSVYFPKVVSSLKIPGFIADLDDRVKGTMVYSIQYLSCLKSMMDMLGELGPKRANAIDRFDQTWAHNIASELRNAGLDIADDAVRDALVRLRTPSASIVNDEVAYKRQEFDVLSGAQDAAMGMASASKLYFSKEETRNQVANLAKVVLVPQLCEVKALVGYTRVLPEGGGLPEGDGVMSKLVDIKTHDEASGQDWYPGYETRGEGIFVQFNPQTLKAWYESNRQVIDARVQTIKDHCKTSFVAGRRLARVSAEFVLIHTIAHLLIKQLSYECGYNVASIRERIYCDRAMEPDGMAGFLVYTAAGDSEGSLGGLVRQGREDLFGKLFRRAIEAAIFCSNDPVCSLSKGQGMDGLNLAACYACALLPETSCEEFNTFLDRGLVVGTIDNRAIGFYSPQLFDARPWDVADPEPVLNEQDPQEPPAAVAKEDILNPVALTGGTHVGDADTYAEVLESLRNGLEDDSPSIPFLNALIAKAGELEGCERPIIDMYCEGQCVDCVWKRHRLVFLSEDNRDARKTLDRLPAGWRVVYLPDPNVDVIAIVDLLKGECE